MTAAHGRHGGVVRGGASRKLAATLQPGTGLRLEWRARLDEHIGSFTVEPLKSRAHLLADRLALAGRLAVGALLVHIGVQLPAVARALARRPRAPSPGGLDPPARPTSRGAPGT